jgi:hypothetical protein
MPFYDSGILWNNEEGGSQFGSDPAKQKASSYREASEEFAVVFVAWAGSMIESGH